ncbi:unnamed protein product [Blepharisma stoltei]|uniref:Uncharacterized protein n=1 Tax=Blepharisma stoltei TaxID=1481888 RepID=A0AAU9J0A8_9CILI|nr:unnamed protein product [Blepharisma stoltei]
MKQMSYKFWSEIYKRSVKKIWIILEIFVNKKMSNPWAVKGGSATLKVVDTGGMGDYCNFLDNLESTEASPEISDELMGKQAHLLEVIDECEKYAIQLKCERDLVKFGEFLNKQQVDIKIELLSKTSNYLKLIKQNRKKLIQHICEESQGELVVEEDMQDSFIRIIEIAQHDSHYYSLLKKSNAIHPQTLENTKSSLNEIKEKLDDCGNRSKRLFNQITAAEEILSSKNIAL